VHYQQLDELFGCRDNVSPELLVCGTGKEKQREEIVDNVKRQAKRKKVDDDDDGIDEALRESIIEMGKCLFSYQILMTE